ncbi:P-loop containing nucleoside triphosphate hydrolase protein [Clohesyomyces aquaticus]|uniref:p-loop containing nucleoside triphosphate hydrolase protein n=1 Tax=Clohesyomyces aquaticus TaxID=1231657 RepID=A0A1Y1ZMC2_9PLEO|nr:P-loop containing nucleoside triphosphate hydrolase protein [Clohesyomyces aquaticus]
MGGATQTTGRKSTGDAAAANLSVATPQPSSGSTIIDEPVSGMGEGSGYATPNNSQPPDARSDVSHASLGLSFSPSHGESTDSHANYTVGGEVDPLGKYVMDVIDTINKLESLGLQKFKIPLPKCVVLGDQSAGKSSVIEGISGITTPRSTDTCTRCPLFIKMHPGDPGTRWNAEVVLRKSFSYDGRSGRGQARRFPGWQEQQTTEEVKFATTSEPTELEGIIGRAQLAILSPNRDPAEFCLSTTMDWQHTPLTEFSPNVVCISVSAPGLPILSFYDLPGTIGQSEDPSRHYLVKFVKDLVREYIADQDALILVACSLENDIHNSQAAGILRDMNATSRSIGVLTKPDRLPPGTREEALAAILGGQKFQLGHGYFSVKNLGQHGIEARISHENARQQERDFFAHNAPWCTSLQHFRHRFGILRLQDYISKKLAAHSLKALPLIRSELQQRLQGVERQLSACPKPPTHNAGNVVSDILLKFSGHIQKEMEGEYPHNTWRNIWETLQADFASGLASMKPTMATYGILDKGLTEPSAPMGASMDDALVLDSEEEEADVDQALPETSSKKRKVEETIATPTGKSMKPSTPHSRFKKSFHLDNVSRELSQISKSKFPDQLQPKVLDAMILETIKHWEEPMKSFFDNLGQQLKGHMQKVFGTTFEPWKDAEIYHAAWVIIGKLMDNHLEEQQLMAKDAFIDEHEGPYIFHREYLAFQKTQVSETYQQARFTKRMNLYFDELDKATNKETSKAERLARVKREAELRKLLSKEPYTNEIEVVAKITSYYLIASRRFHDSICMRIESKFFKLLRTQLRNELASKLRIFDEDGHSTCMRLLAEPAERQAKRQELENARAALLKGQAHLDDLAARYAEEPSAHG